MCFTSKTQIQIADQVFKLIFLPSGQPLFRYTSNIIVQRPETCLRLFIHHYYQLVAFMHESKLYYCCMIMQP